MTFIVNRGTFSIIIFQLEAFKQYPDFICRIVPSLPYKDRTSKTYGGIKPDEYDGWFWTEKFMRNKKKMYRGLYQSVSDFLVSIGAMIDINGKGNNDGKTMFFGNAAQVSESGIAGEVFPINWV
jgi:hypothetical protein